MSSFKSGLSVPLKKKRLHSISLPQVACNRSATVYLAAVVEYLIAEVAELSGYAARNERQKVVDDIHVVQVIRNDEELRKLAEDLPNVLLPSNEDAFVENENQQNTLLEELFEAVSSEQYDIAKQILNSTGGIDQFDSTGNTLLHRQSQEGSVEGIQFLIENHANVNIVNKKNQTPLHVAALQCGDEADEHSEACLQLLSSGADINCRDSDGRTPLHLSFKVGGLYIAKKLVKQGAALDASDSRGDTILHYLFTYVECTRSRFWFLMKSILSKHPEMINQKNDDGFTPFQVLVESHGSMPDVMQLTKWGSWRESSELLEKIVYVIETTPVQVNGLAAHEKFPYTSPLCMAVNSGGIAIMKSLLIRGKADILERDSYGRTALHLACEQSDEKIIALLCEYGGEKLINQVDDNGVPPYLLVVHQDEEKVFPLIDYFAFNWNVDWRRQDEYGRNIAHYLLLNVPSNDCLSILSRFEKQYLEKLLTEPDSSGMTSLHLIASDPELSEELLRSKLYEGIDVKKLVNQRDSLGRTPFLLCVANASGSVCQLLLEWGADVTIPDNNGETPIFFAVGVQNDDELATLKMLLDHDADFNWCNNEGRTFWIDFIDDESMVKSIKEKLDVDKAFEIFRHARKQKKIEVEQEDEDISDEDISDEDIADDDMN